MAMAIERGASVDSETPQAGRSEAEAWTESWRRNEFSYLRDQLEELERRLRRRTVVLGGALAVSLGLTAAMAAVTFVETPLGTWTKASATAAP